MVDEPDGDLPRRFVQGDRDAFEWLFTRFHREVHRWSQRIVRDATAADDVVVEAFWRAYRGRARFDPSRSFGAWIRRIATNVARDHLRTARVHAALLEHAPATMAASAPDRGVAEAIERALRRLPPRLQIVAMLALIEERPPERRSGDRVRLGSGLRTTGSGPAWGELRSDIHPMATNKMARSLEPGVWSPTKRPPCPAIPPGRTARSRGPSSRRRLVRGRPSR